MEPGSAEKREAITMETTTPTSSAISNRTKLPLPPGVQRVKDLTPVQKTARATKQKQIQRSRGKLTRLPLPPNAARASDLTPAQKTARNTPQRRIRRQRARSSSISNSNSNNMNSNNMNDLNSPPGGAPTPQRVGVSTPQRDDGAISLPLLRSPVGVLRENRVNTSIMSPTLTSAEMATWSPNTLEEYKNATKQRLQGAQSRMTARANAIESGRQGTESGRIWAENTQRALEGIDRDEAVTETTSIELQQVIHAGQLMKSPQRQSASKSNTSNTTGFASLSDKPDMIISPAPTKSRSSSKTKTVVSRRKNTKFKHSHEYNELANKSGFARASHIGLNLKPKTLSVKPRPKKGDGADASTGDGVASSDEVEVSVDGAGLCFPVDNGESF